MKAADWIIVPVIDLFDYTKNAIDDFLAQEGVDPRVLVINNGSSNDTRSKLELWQERDHRVHVWSHNPPLPSLSASWNTALDFVWRVGGETAWVVNNDVRVHPLTYASLKAVALAQDALFVTAVGVREQQYEAFLSNKDALHVGDYTTSTTAEHGGPDFSCFLITKACHAQYRFDEKFIPAFREDCSYHREMMLGGDGEKIFSVNIPYLHYASRTVNQSDEARQRYEAQAHLSKEHYIRAWGGEVNHERFSIKFDPESAQDGITNPKLQAAILGLSAKGDQKVG